MTLLTVEFLVRLGKALEKGMEADAELRQIIKELKDIKNEEVIDDIATFGDVDSKYHGSTGYELEGYDLPCATGESGQRTYNYNINIGPESPLG